MKQVFSFSHFSHSGSGHFQWKIVLRHIVLQAHCFTSTLFHKHIVSQAYCFTIILFHNQGTRYVTITQTYGTRVRLIRLISLCLVSSCLDSVIYYVPL